MQRAFSVWPLLLVLLGGAALAVCQWLIFFYAPVEAQLGLMQKVFYTHLPLAWWALISFLVVFVASIVYLIRRSPAADRVCAAAAEVGVLLAGLALVTGMIWARRSWGVWWMWAACRACRSPACMLPDRAAVRRRGPGMELAGINPLYLIAGLALLGLAPFLLMMVTSYVKIVVVTSLVRNALGVQQVPPAMVMNGLAIILTVFIMAPVAMDTKALLEEQRFSANPKPSEMLETLQAVSPPLRQFLEKNTSPAILQEFMGTAQRIWPEHQRQSITRDNMFILVPAFTITELTKAFQIGFLLYLPFVAIDLIISNVLLAMGMMMVSPMTISLPFKLLLFVTLDGWLKISQGLLLSYQ